jgi:outer membrane lipoprotein-sorting protein
MMKKIIVVILALVMILSLVACGSKKDQAEDTMDEKPQSEQADDSEQAEDIKADETKIDESLTGIQLLNQLNYKTPDAMVMTSEATVEGMPPYTFTTYTKGEDQRVESDTQVGVSVMIHSAKDRMSYHYIVGDNQGMKISDDIDISAEMGIQSDTSMPTIEAIKDEGDVDVIASVQELDGEKVVYIQTTDNSGPAEYIMHMWCSVAYGFPLKYEVESGGKIIMSSRVVDYDFDAKIDEAMFMPPNDVNFMDMSDMMG